jgi:hypothetical protein
LHRGTRSTAPGPAKPKRGAKAKAAAPAAPSPPLPVAMLPGSSKTRASKRRATTKKPPTPESESESVSESEELPLGELMSIPAGEEVDLSGTLSSGTTNKGAALDEEHNAGDGNDMPEDRARSVSPSTRMPQLMRSTTGTVRTPFLYPPSSLIQVQRLRESTSNPRPTRTSTLHPRIPRASAPHLRILRTKSTLCYSGCLSLSLGCLPHKYLNRA